MSLREQIRQFLRGHPWSTSAQITDALLSAGTEGARNRVRLMAMVSSVVNREVKQGVVQRKAPCGPRGGYGYYLPWTK